MTGLEIGATTTIIASEAVKLSVSDLYCFLKQKSKDYVSKWRAEKGIAELFMHVESIRKVKTIWQIDKSVDLREFYVPPHVRRNNGKRIKLTSLISLNSDSPILLEGIAGQGKSTLMRYLCAQEMVEGSTLPIFIELRRIKKEESIFSHISRYLDILGLNITKELFLEYLEQGKISFFLDGFDEVENIVQHSLIQDIELICQKGKNCNVIVTSRPGQAIKALPCLELHKLDNLIKDEYKEVVFKISENRDYAESLIKVVDNHNKDIKGILCTPLLVTLLVISYKSYQQIPEQLSDFYDSLFRVLLQRHDGTKPAYSRPRITKLNDIKFRECFEQFCYLIKAHKKQVYQYNNLVDTAKKSINKLNLEICPENLIKDISDVTCLLVNDGEEWRYIHKSIQEYFAASHIKNQSEISAQKIYSEFVRKYRPEWATELSFLSEIDNYRHAKYYYLPSVKKIMKITTNIESAKPTVNMSVVKSILGSYSMELIFKKEKEGIEVTVSIDHNTAPPLHRLNDASSSFFVNQFKNIFNKKIETRRDENIIKIDLNSILSSKTPKDEAFKFVENQIDMMYEEALNIEERIKRIESESIDDGLFD